MTQHDAWHAAAAILGRPAEEVEVAYDYDRYSGGGEYVVAVQTAAGRVILAHSRRGWGPLLRELEERQRPRKAVVV